MTDPIFDARTTMIGPRTPPFESPSTATDTKLQRAEPPVVTRGSLLASSAPAQGALSGATIIDPGVVQAAKGRRTLAERADEIGARFLEELVQARQMTGRSQAKLTEEIGGKRGAIARLEAGSGSVEMLIVMMDALAFHIAGIGAGDTLGEQLTNRREQLSLSVEHVAAKTQMSEAVITDLENGRGMSSDLFRLLALIAPKVRRRAPERVYWGQAEKVARDSRFTPAEFMAAVYDAFGPVDLDPCAHPMSPVIATRRIVLAEGGDGLTDQWTGRLAFVNAPYSTQLLWLKRAYQQWSAGYVQTVVCLLPVRTDNKFFHETLHKDADLFLLKGRLRFSDLEGNVQPTPFSLWIVALGAAHQQKARFAELVAGCWFRTAAPSLVCDQAKPRHGTRRRVRKFGLLYRNSRRRVYRR